MFNDLLNNNDLLHNNNEYANGIDMDGVMTLNKFDDSVKYFTCNNKWKLSLNTLFTLCEQGLITSGACSELMRLSDPAELIFACQIAEFELNNKVNILHYNNVNDYRKAWDYLKYNKSIVTYQRIRHEQDRIVKEFMFINGIPLFKIINKKFEPIMEDYKGDLVQICNSYRDLDSTISSCGLSYVNVHVQQLLPENINHRGSLGIENDSECMIELFERKNNYHSQKLLEAPGIGHLVSLYLDRNKINDSYDTQNRSSSSFPVYAYCTYKLIKFHCLPSIPKDMLHPDNIETINNYRSNLCKEYTKLLGEDCMIKMDYKTSRTSIRVYCGYIKV